MFEYMIAINIAKLEIERLDRKIEQRRRAGLMRHEEKKHLLTGLAMVGSNVLMSLGSALVSTGKRLSGQRTSGRAAAA